VCVWVKILFLGACAVACGGWWVAVFLFFYTFFIVFKAVVGF
jgi:hypothetical protein